MPRVKSGVQAHARHKKVIKAAAGYRGRRKNCFRVATQAVDKARQYATVIARSGSASFAASGSRVSTRRHVSMA